MEKKVTMQDIAKRLNISKNSVSQALSGKAGVSEETRKLIQDTADELGYSYSNNRTQKPIEEKTVKTIGLIASELAFSLTGFFGEIYLSIQKELKARDMNFLIESIDQHSVENLIMPNLLTNQEIDGLLILSHISTDYTAKVISSGIPTVLIDHHEPFLHADSILTNNRFAAFTAVEHLIKLGHTEISFVGDVDISPSYQERLEGYFLALKRYGIKQNEAFLLNHAKEEQSHIKGLLDQLTTQPTAYFCVNDGLGFLIQSELQQRGFNVPDDVSICSFDNGQLSQIASPKMTTMDIDLNFFGKKAVEQLCWRIENKDEPIHEILLPTRLIIRESTGELGKI
ncbi:LacI family DNA-binding transcriptional regulator [Arthrobacter citreus]|nr:LacI family DNA-binding transcriptional regulator [Arthrobacter citreus]